MILQKPTKSFISEILKVYADEGGDQLNEALLKLFQTFDNDQNKPDVLLKVAALNKIYATAIANINPVVENIWQISNSEAGPKKTAEYVAFVDIISKVSWTNSKGEWYYRNNLSFSSKYVHFLSRYKTPIYDSYIWILINGYLGQKNKAKIIFTKPASFKQFYLTFKKFKKEFDLEAYSNYEIDKFLWQYAKQLVQDIKIEKSVNLNQAKSELKKRIKLTV